MRAAGRAGRSRAGGRSGAALARGGRRAARRELRFAVVHPHSGHNYELRYWLAACGIDPDRDVEIVVLPPPLMPDAISHRRHRRLLRGRALEQRRAWRSGAGRIATVKAAIWPRQPGKGAGRHRELGRAQSRGAGGAAARAATTRRNGAANPANHAEAAALLAAAGLSRHAGGTDRRARCRGGIVAARGESVTRRRTSSCRTRIGDAIPWIAHALWFYCADGALGRRAAHAQSNAALARRLVTGPTSIGSAPFGGVCRHGGRGLGRLLRRQAVRSGRPRTPTSPSQRPVCLKSRQTAYAMIMRCG